MTFWTSGHDKAGRGQLVARKSDSIVWGVGLFKKNKNKTETKGENMGEACL